MTPVLSCISMFDSYPEAATYSLSDSVTHRLDARSDHNATVASIARPALSSSSTDDGWLPYSYEVLAVAAAA